MALAAQDDFFGGESSLRSKEKNKLLDQASIFGWQVAVSGGGWQVDAAGKGRSDIRGLCCGLG